MAKLPKTPAFWQKRGWKAWALLPLSKVYIAMMRLDQREQKPREVNIPVWCVGNVTVGGSGKTPLVCWLADWLQTQGVEAHIILRGFGGELSSDKPLRVNPTIHSHLEVGDEALLLARHAPTWICRDRVAATNAAETAGAQMVLLDDGLQHWRIEKDVSFLVFDGGTGVGNAFCLPAGPLREPLPEVLGRVDAVIHMGQETSLPSNELPYFYGQIVADAPADIQSIRWMPFAGLGRPEKFFETLKQLGANIVEPTAFPDHHPYTASEIAALQHRAAKHGAKLITTEKDAVRIPKEFAADIEVLPIRVTWINSTEWLEFLTQQLPPR